jgi:DNA-binding transcriptional MerR regulator
MDTVPRDRILSARDAAAMVGVRPGTLRLWVHRGYLTPCAQHREGRTTVNYYWASDVRRTERARRPARRDTQLRDLGASFVASLAQETTSV